MDLDSRENKFFSARVAVFLRCLPGRNGGSEVENMLDYKSKGLRFTLPIILSFG